MLALLGNNNLSAYNLHAHFSAVGYRSCGILSATVLLAHKTENKEKIDCYGLVRYAHGNTDIHAIKKTATERLRSRCAKLL